MTGDGPTLTLLTLKEAESHRTGVTPRNQGRQRTNFPWGPRKGPQPARTLTLAERPVSEVPAAECQRMWLFGATPCVAVCDSSKQLTRHGSSLLRL